MSDELASFDYRNLGPIGKAVVMRGERTEKRSCGWNLRLRGDHAYLIRPYPPQFDLP